MKPITATTAKRQTNFTRTLAQPDFFIFLDSAVVVLDDEEKASLVGSIKSGLKELAKFKLNEETIRLGTDWEGY